MGKTDVCSKCEGKGYLEEIDVDGRTIHTWECECQNRGGMKFDSGKPRYDLLPYKELESVVRVLTMGSEKYSDDNWKRLPVNKIFAALMRHVTAWAQGEVIDPESGEPHMAHATCEALFLMWHDAKKEGDR